MKIFFALLASILVSTTAAQAAPISVVLEVAGLRNTTGQILLAAFNSPDGFPDKAKPIATGTANPIMAKTLHITLQLEPGTYAFTYFHDENDNGEFDTGAFGIPKEGFGFSNNPTIGMSAPSFNACAVVVNTAGQVISMTTKYY